MNKDFEQGVFFVKSENLAITRFTNMLNSKIVTHKDICGNVNAPHRI